MDFELMIPDNISMGKFKDQCKQVKEMCKNFSHLFGEICTTMTYDQEHALLKIKLRKSQHARSFEHLVKRYELSIKKDYRFKGLSNQVEDIITRLSVGETVCPDDIIYDEISLDMITIFGGVRTHEQKRRKRPIIRSFGKKRDN